jgi:hypothetical protein
MNPLCYRLSLVALLLSLFQPIRAQVRLRIGPEAGVSISRLPWERQFEDIFGRKSTETMRLYLGPLVGGHAQVQLRKHWQFGLSLRYQKTGERFQNVREEAGIELTNRNSYVFHQISMPVTAGYRFQIKNIPFAISAGGQASFFLQGTHEHYYQYEPEVPLLASSSGLSSLNLFKGEAWWYTDNRLQGSLHANVAFFPADRVKVIIGYSTTHQLLYSKNDIYRRGPCDCLYIYPYPQLVEFRRYDVNLAVAYFLR